MTVALRSRLVPDRFVSPRLKMLARRRTVELLGVGLGAAALGLSAALVSYSPRDPSFDTASAALPGNLVGLPGAVAADLLIQGAGLACALLPLAMLGWAWRITTHRGVSAPLLRVLALLLAIPALATTLAGVPVLLGLRGPAWPGPAGLGGALGLHLTQTVLRAGHDTIGRSGGPLLWSLCVLLALAASPISIGLSARDWRAAGRRARHAAKLSAGYAQRGPRSSSASEDGLAPEFGPAQGSRSLWRRGRADRPDAESPRVGERPRGTAPGLSMTLLRTLRRRPVRVDEEMPDFSSDPASAGPSPFTAQAQVHIQARARSADAARPGPEPGRATRGRERREPYLRTEAVTEAKPPSLGGYIMPPGLAEDQDDMVLAPRPAGEMTRQGAPDALPQPTGAVPRPTGGLLAKLLRGGDAAPAATGRDAQARQPAATRLSPARPYAAAHRDDAEEPWSFPPLSLLQAPPHRASTGPSPESLQANARLLETVLSDYGVHGAIGEIHAGPVVTLYELEPAPGIRSARVIGLADDVARSLSVTAVRIATVPGRNVIGIEVPNQRRETVLFSELIRGEAWDNSSSRLCLALGKDISGAPVYADLARMPHLLIAGTTGSGKSVGVNAMILSLLYRLSPQECRLILIDPKMLELSIYDGIPHLMAPVVTQPAKAVTALKWTVREMERRYRGMSQLGVRNIGGYNERVAAARASGEVLMRRVQTGFDPETGKPTFEDQTLSLENLPYIVVVIDEMADLMMVAGKEIEAAVQRLAQMARAAGIHVIMATQRPSVDVITGTIKANFPTRISFQVISKFDSRTILGEQGAEQLLGQGDMLYMQGGGRITRVHGPFVGDGEVEDVVRHLRQQGEPAYLDDVTSVFEEEDSGGSGSSGPAGGGGNGLGGGAFDSETGLFDQAVQLVSREGKASTSFIQRHLSIGYNRAAKLIEQMEKEGVVGPANHVGKREVLVRRESAED